MASAGDVNGDGFDDLVVGAKGVQTERGRAYVYLGGQSGLSPTPVVLAGPGGVQGSFGISAASAGDVNGDGFGDLVVGAKGVEDGAGSAYVYFGSAGGI